MLKFGLREQTKESPNDTKFRKNRSSDSALYVACWYCIDLVLMHFDF